MSAPSRAETSLVTDRRLGWAIGARNEAGRDRKSIPCVDGRQRERQIAQFLLAESRSDLLVQRVGHVSIRDQRHRFGPRERRALTLRVVGALAPGIERVEALLALPARTQILPVHVEAIGTAVDLCGAKPTQVEQWILQH